MMQVDQSREKYTAEGTVHEDVAHPINKETRQMFTDEILKAYESAE